MENLKIRVNNETESREVQDILFSVGKTHDDGSTDHYQFCFGKYPHFINCEAKYISASRTGYLSYDEITLPELRAMVNQDQDEPFLTPETTLNDQYAEIEQVRQAIKVKSGSDSDHALDAMSFGFMGARAAQSTKDNVNHPSHYTQGKVECIDALESATIGKSGIEAVCVANVIKYLWRYEDKGGLESILKAKWYLDKLIECKK